MDELTAEERLRRDLEDFTTTIIKSNDEAKNKSKPKGQLRPKNNNARQPAKRPELNNQSIYDDKDKNKNKNKIKDIRDTDIDDIFSDLEKELNTANDNLSSTRNNSAQNLKNTSRDSELLSELESVLELEPLSEPELVPEPEPVPALHVPVQRKPLLEPEPRQTRRETLTDLLRLPSPEGRL